jgi:hypothetical protein
VRARAVDPWFVGSVPPNRLNHLPALDDLDPVNMPALSCGKQDGDSTPANVRIRFPKEILILRHTRRGKAGIRRGLGFFGCGLFRRWSVGSLWYQFSDSVQRRATRQREDCKGGE